MIEKQEPVAWTDKYGEDFCHKSTNYFNVPLYSAPQSCPECEKLKAARDELAAHLTQTQQELFLTKGSLLVRNKQLEEANIQLVKLQDTLSETEAYCKRKDTTIDLLKQRLETMYE
jgi:hypothetical protein